MICCSNCFNDQELIAEIQNIGRIGECPICGAKDVFIYDSELNYYESSLEDMLVSVIDIYVPESELPPLYPEGDKDYLINRLCKDWNMFVNNFSHVEIIVKHVVENSIFLSTKLLVEKVGIPQLYEEEYLSQHSILFKCNWNEFKRHIRNVNRFHNDFVNKQLLEEILEQARITIPKNTIFYRARVSNERGTLGFSEKEMGAPPFDVATAGRANSKGQSCLYLSNERMTTLKEIRAHAFDYVTIAEFRLLRDIQVLDLCSITHSSPFYTNTNKVDYYVNERILSAIEKDLAKPMSRWDSDLDYLPTQYISDFARFCGYDGIRYFSTFDKDAYNLALFDSSTCECLGCKNHLIGNLNYNLSDV